MKNDVVFDRPRTVGIEEFLNMIYDIRKSNPEMQISKNVVYNELCRNGIKKDDMTEDRDLVSNRYMFEKWFERFKNNPNVAAFCAESFRYFFQFCHGNMNNEEEYIKLYIPIDSEHLYEGVNRLFDYISKLGIDHSSKVSERLRSDNVIVRLRHDDYYNALKIINFVKSDPYISEGLNSTNPLVPNVNGIGLMRESGISYNSEMASLIARYVNYCYDHNIPKINIEDFNAWMKQNNYDEEVDRVYNQANGKKENQFTSSQKVSLLIDALTATYQKYGPRQAKKALLSAINGDYGYFTNGNSRTVKYRRLLFKSVSPAAIKLFVCSAVEQIRGKKVSANEKIEDIVSQYFNYLFSDNMTVKFEEACKVTIANYGSSHCAYAISKMINTGNVDSFSRFLSDGTPDSGKVNYRDIVANFDKDNVMEAVKKSLKLRGINTDGLSNRFLIHQYTHELQKSIYSHISENVGLSRH